MYWVINSCRKSGINNERIMLDKNVFYIGFGTPSEERHKKKSNTTNKQFQTFLRRAQKGDAILLYANKCGIIATAKYTGEYFSPDENDKAPDWDSDEIQCHIKVTKWHICDSPIKYRARPPTLYSTENINI